MKYEFLDEKSNITVILEVRKQKNIILHFRPNTLYITSPKRLGKDKLLEYLDKYKNKIISLNSDDDPNLDYLCLWGKRYILKVIKSVLNDYKIENDTIYIFLKNVTLASTKAGIKEMYNRELSLVINDYLLVVKNKLKENELFKDKLYALDKVNINYYKTFLGRCFIKSKRIELSSYLAKYDPKYILGVIYHEMTHLIIPSHDKYFHKILDTIYPENRILTKEMKSMNSIITKDFL